MAVKIALDSFLTVLKRSNLVPPDQLQTLVDEFQRSPGRSNDARAFADALVARKALTPWQAEKLLQGKHKGFFLGKYRLLSLVGKGGMSTVYLAEHVLMRRLCAIKVLPTRRLQNASYLARFHREAQAVASLDHRNIVRAYDVDHAADGETEIHFLVMEYVEGKGLLDLVLSCPNSRLPPVVAAEYIRQAALGLQHAHSAGLVHRDVKPGNLLIDTQGTVKILDLGLARFFESGDENSLTVQHDERVLGTADYLAPEQAVDSHRVDARADIYSLGCTLYLCLAGQPPFTQGSLAQRLLAHQTREPPTVESIEPQVPTSLGDIVRKMMAKDPANRYQTAADVASALEEWLKGTPKTDFDRTFAGLDRPTPFPPDRRSESARADTVRRGSRADTSSTPHVERKGKEAPPSPNTPLQTRAKSPAPEAPARTKPPQPSGNASTLLRPDDQETTIGGPPVPPEPPPPAAPPDSAVPFNPDKDEAPAPLSFDSVDFSSERFDPGGPAPFDLEAEDEETPTPKRSSRKRNSPWNEFVPKLKSWQAQVQDQLRTRFPERQQQTQVKWAAGGTGAVALLGLLIWAFQKPETPAVTPPSQPKPPAPAPVVEKRDLGPELTVGGEKADFPTIGAALGYVRENRQKFSGNSTWTINVTGGREYAEVLRVVSSGADPFPKGVTIASVGDAPAILRPAGSGPVVELDGVERLTLRGFVLEGAERAVVAHLQGFLVGTRLESLEFRSITGVGIGWDDLTGLSSSPVQFSRLRFFGDSPAAVAVRMGDVRQLAVSECWFVGPMATGIEFSSSVWNSEVGLSKCLFHDCQAGIRFSNSGQDLQRITILNNTFHRVQRGLQWDAMPQSGSSELTIRHNLFVGVTNAEAEVRTGFDAARAAELLPPGSAVNNRTDRAADTAIDPAGGFDLFAEGERGMEDPGFASTDPANPGFLKPTSPSVANGVKSAAQGADPIVGAIAP